MTVTMNGRLASKTGATRGIARLLGSTALAGIVVIVLAQDAAAQTRYYDFNDSGDVGLNPETGGFWNLTDDNFAGNGAGGGGTNNFSNGNAVVFRQDTANQATAVIIQGTVAPDYMQVQSNPLAPNTSWVFRGDSSDGEDVLRADNFGDNIDISAGTSVLINIRSENGFDYFVRGNLDLRTDGDGVRNLVIDSLGSVTVNTLWDGVLTDISGGVLVDDADSTLTVRALGINNQDLINEGTTILQGALRLTEGSNTPRVVNRNILEFESGAQIIGGILNDGGAEISLEANGTINAINSAEGIDNQGTIKTVGAARTLALRGEATNSGTLDATEGTLTVTVDDLTLESSSLFVGNVLLQGDVTNQIANYDMAQIPTMEGDFTNEASVTLGAAVLGNGHVLTNDAGASFSTTNNSVTGLASVANAGDMDVLGTATIGATGNFVNSGDLTVGAGATIQGAQIRHQEEAPGSPTNAALASTGTLIGDVRISADADLANAVEGDLAVSGGTTEITDDLSVTTGTGTGRVRVTDGATMVMATGAELSTAGGLTVTGATSELDLGTNGSIIGNATLGGDLSGVGSISGNVTLTTDFDSDSAGLAVGGQLTNQATNQISLSDFSSFSANNIVNQSNLVMNRAYTGSVTNTTGSTLTVNSALTGRLVTDGTANLSADIENADANNAVFVRGGITNITGDMTVSAAVPEVMVVGNDGTLNVSGGDLDVEGAFRSQGNVTVASNRTLQANMTDFSHGAVTINGSLTGGGGAGSAVVTNGATSEMTLDGALISGQLTNLGNINWPTPGASTTGRNTVILNGLVNESNANIGQAGLAATVRGAVTNSGTLNLIGGVFQSTAGIASVDNTGDLSITGRVAGNVTSTDGSISLTGPIDGNVTNSADATIASNVGGAVTNTGDMDFRGAVAGAITNSGAGASLTTTGQVSAASISNNAEMNIAAGTRVLTTGAGPTIDSQSGALNIAGRVVGDVTAADGSDLDVAAGGVITGALDTGATTTIAGQVGGATNLQSSGSLELSGNARTDALTAAAGSSVTVTAGSDVTVGDFSNSSDDTRILGSLTGNVTNNDGTSKITLGNSGTIDGNFSNGAGATLVTAGTVTGNTVNNGTITLNGNAEFEGNLVNNDRINQNVTSATLTVDGTLTNNADIIAGAGQTMFINAGVFVNGGGSTISGDVRMAGDVRNAGTLNWNTDGALSGNVTNLAGPPVANIFVSANMDGSGFDVQNNGNVEIAETGALTNLDVYGNRGTTSIAEGGTLGADMIVNQPGGSLTNAGTLDGDVANRNGATLTSTGTITGGLTNGGTALISGNAGDITNAATGNLTITNRLVSSGDLMNLGTATIERGTTTFGQVTNRDELTVAAGARLRTDSLINSGVATLNGAFTGRVTNSGALTAAGDLNVVSNTRTGTIDTGGAASLTTNQGQINAENLVAGGSTVVNNGTLNITGDGTTGGVAGASFRNNASATFGGSLNINSVNAGTLNVTRDVLSLNNVTATSTSEIGRHVLGNAVNSGNLTIGGRVSGNLTTNSSGTSEIGGPVRGNVISAGNTTVGGNVGRGVTVTGGSTTVSGSIIGNATNRAPDATLRVQGNIGGNLTNAGTTVLGGNVGGAIQNGGTLRYGPTLSAQSLSNTATFVIAQPQSVTLDQTASNFGPNGDFRIHGTLTAGGGVTNHAGARMVASGTSTINANVSNIGRMTAIGTLDGNMTNTGNLTLGGHVTGDVTHSGGSLTYQSGLQIDGRLILGGGGGAAAAAQLGARATSEAGLMAAVTASTSVPAGETVDVGEELIIADGGDLTLDGRLNAAGTQVLTGGTLAMTGTLGSSLITRGTSDLAGSILGDVTYAEGEMTVTDDLNVTGNIALNQDFTLANGIVLTANNTNVATDVLAQMMGTLNSDVRVAGQMDIASTGGVGGDVTLANGATLNMAGDIGGGLSVGTGATVTTTGSRNIGGAMTNNGTVDMADGTVGDRLTIGGGTSGTGVYALDIDLSGDTGLTDSIAVTGGATTGDITLNFAFDSDTGVSDRAKRLLVLDVSGTGNTANVTANGLPAASERIVYRLAQEEATGDWYVRDGINDAIAAIVGNVVLTQSLIGSVVNRPTSPFVQGLAAEDDDPCGAGAWARATAGKADATGSSVSNEQTSSSSISASYSGIQFGADFACFQGHYKGWDMAFGVIGGLNKGSTSQPIYRQFNGDATDIIDSRNAADFRQTYGGAYVTASRDRLSADLQIRQEKTDFTVNNTPTAGQTNGLGLTDTEFSSDATTVSGSLSYSMPLPRDGWQFVPTAGFAWSQISTDTIIFDEVNGLGSQLAIDDSESRVGFVGGTVSRTFVNSAGNAAVNAFATATVYRDFASDTESTYTMFNADGSVFREDRLSSSNLGTYGELSVGANYIRLLNPGRAGRPRQLNAAVRVDGRTGESLDSYGLTAQLRLQF